MVNPTVLTSTRDGVARIALNRPERRNAVDGPTAAALHDAVRAAVADEAVGAIVLTGNGPSFCAGWDVAAIGELRALDEAAVREAFAANKQLLDDFASAPVPTVAAVHGPVLGFGIGLLAAADVVIGAASATVGLPEVPLGIVPGMVMADLLHALPPKLALDWLLTGETRSAAEALTAGLFTRVVADEAFDDAVDALGSHLAALDRATVRETKESFRRLQALDRDAAVGAAVDAAVAALLRR